MLVNKTVMVRWNGSTRKHYESKGYLWTKQNELFECRIEDVMRTSTVRVDVECDYCTDGVAYKEYRSYLKEREIVAKDCCKNRKCMVAKSEEVNLIKYGETNYSKTDKSRQHNRELFQTPIDEVMQLANSKGLEISNIEDYQNDRTRLFVICKSHSEKGIQETNFANIKKNKHCCIYVRPEITSVSRKLAGQLVYDDFLKYELIPLFNPNDYKGNDTPLPYKCAKHLEKGVQYRTYANLPYSTGCEYCSRERTKEKLRLDHTLVFDYFFSKGLIVLENQTYQNKDQQIYYRCESHLDYIQCATYSNLQKTNIPCEHCRIEQSLSPLNRKLRSAINIWKKESEIACEYKCVLTGSEKYEIHHIYSFNSIIKDALKELSIDIKDSYESHEFIKVRDKVIEMHDNYLGVCLRPDIHTLFHQMYGIQNNTLEQFEEYKINFINNKIICKEVDSQCLT